MTVLGLYDVIRDRLQAGEQRTHYQDVTDALLVGRREPLWEPAGKGKRKVQMSPLPQDRHMPERSRPRAKGDQDPAEWLPPAKDALCTYATAWVATSYGSS